MKKKIAFYLKKFKVGGIETTLIQYLNNIDLDRFDVDLVLGIKQFPAQPLLLRLSPQIKIKYVIDESFSKNIKLFQHVQSVSVSHRVCYSLISRPLIKLLLQIKLVKILSEYDCVIDYGLTLDFLVKRIRSNVIGFFHFRISHHYKPNRVSRRHGKTLPAYHKIVAINSTILNDAIKIYPHCAEKFILLFNQFDFDAINQLADEFVLDNRINNDFIISIGRLVDGKDLSTLIRAYKLYRDDYSGEELLYIIGAGSDGDSLRHLCAELRLNEYVEFFGYMVNPMPWLKNAKLFALTSIIEALPSVIIEASILRVPVISSDCPDGPAEMLLDGAAGVLVNVGDVAGFAAGFNALINNSTLRAQVVNSATSGICRFDIKQNIETLQQLF